MKSTDKFLLGIVIAAIVLVAAAFAVVLTRPKPAYQAEDTPEGVVHNYLLALREDDYERAYGYLLPTIEGYPESARAFEEDIQNSNWAFGPDDTSTAVEVVSARLGANTAVVTVRETSFHQGGLFDSSQYARTFDMQLRRDPRSGAWRISQADSYWSWCWNREGGCR